MKYKCNWMHLCLLVSHHFNRQTWVLFANCMLSEKRWMKYWCAGRTDLLPLSTHLEWTFVLPQREKRKVRRLLVWPLLSQHHQLTWSNGQQGTTLLNGSTLGLDSATMKCPNPTFYLVLIDYEVTVGDVVFASFVIFA